MATPALSLPTITDEYWRLFGEGPMSMYIFDVAGDKFLMVNSEALIQYGYYFSCNSLE